MPNDPIVTSEDLSIPGDADLQQSRNDEMAITSNPDAVSIASEPLAEPVVIEGDERLRPFQGGTLTKLLFGGAYEGGTRHD